ncbi:MAG: hypothetical protein LQ352_003678 [Teloschistes flavicans]|nr:MAG: hypothetical protein LQ352_003678 [Teloschistes flavicans]
MSADVVQLHLAADQDFDAIERDPETRPSKGKKAAQKTDARDISWDFRTAASALKTGQLVKDPYFTLFEAVGALEIMDSKMDSGYLTDGEKLEDDFDVLHEVLPEEIVGLMDQILCLEMAWHMGYPLSQSLFTSYHIDRLLWPNPKVLDEASFDRHRGARRESSCLHVVYRAYCLAVIKCCDYVHRRIGTEHYYEEEDFVSNLYNRNFLTHFNEVDIRKLLDEALEYTERQASIEEVTRYAISTRLNLRRRMLDAVASDLDLSKNAQSQKWMQCLELLPKLHGSHHVAKAVKEAFTIKIQRRMASSVPPRPMVEIDFEDAHTFLKHLCRDAADVYNVIEYHGSSNILNFAYIFQSRKPQPSIYIRCLLQSLIFHDMKILGSVTITKLIFDDLEELTLPADVLLDPANGDVEAPHDPRFQIAQAMREHVLRIGDPFLDMFRALCMNRSRMRRMLCHLIVDWENVQLEAENLDMKLRNYTGERPLTDGEATAAEVWSFPLSSWAYYYKLRQMEWIIQMGFELRIYQNDELSGMYWYLGNVAAAKIQHLERIQTFVMRRFKQTKKRSPDQKKRFNRCFSFLDVTLLESSATQWFAIALSKSMELYTGLSHFSLITDRCEPVPYSTPELRHALRIRPFMQLSIPELPSYAELSDATSMTRSVGETDEDQVLSMLDIAEEATKVARKDWEALGKVEAEKARCVNCEEWWRASVKDVVRACIACSIATATMKKAIKTPHTKPVHEVLKVEMPSGKAYHEFWLVPKVSL